MDKTCNNCKYWGTGDGTGDPYDAGHMNYCNHPSVSGIQHPSYGVGKEVKTMLYTGTDNSQIIMTRYSFGCILHVDRKYG